MKRILLRVITVILSIALLIPLHPSSHALSAGAYCLMDGDTGEILFASREDAELPMASTTKIMTCLVAIREGDLYKEVSVPDIAVGVEGSSVYLKAGEKICLLDLLYALMLQSANDAAVAIAYSVSGSVEAFVDRMNVTAASIGMIHTHFVNPHGLSANGHYSSAKDLCLLLNEAMNDEIFAEITGTVKHSIPASDGGKLALVNHNKLLSRYEYCVGGKTGFTTEAGRCLVTVARKSGKNLICATINDPDDWNDHKSLFEQGFSLYHEVTFCKFAEIFADLPVVGGELDSVTVTNLDPLSGLLRSDSPVTMVLELPSFLYAPVPGIEITEKDTYVLRRHGVSVGDAVFYQGTREVARVPLYPTLDVGAAERNMSLWEKICSWFHSLWEWFTGLWKK